MENNKPDNVITVEDLSFTYGNEMVLDSLNLSVNKGETLVILGGSGAGKSTLLRLIIALIRPTRGRLTVFDKDINLLSERQLRPMRSRMGFVFQGGALFDSITVAENVGYALRINNPRISESEFKKTVMDILDYVEMTEFYSSYPADLSGGQRKRIAIARATITHPEIILYDEPTSGLDPIVSKRINQLINRLRIEQNITSIVVTHILQDAFEVATRLVMLKNGRLVFEGQSDDLLLSKDPYVQQFVR
ncbi:MAG: ATP-binding cassette domain-containing protein [Deferribacteres bacterium]|nr:ATP-binding cassette domain-containing protein [candidate division KSB1 bacterium]MCB9502786.1 ATP-binding cassette domain-containing protein [Deferribacteres bacterium]